MTTTAAITDETPADAPAVEALVAAAFGPGRFAKTAERLRERAALAFGLVVRGDAGVTGSVRLWRIVVGETPVLFLGPITVKADQRKALLGARLVEAAVARAEAEGAAGVLLVGDLAYFERFGFVSALGAVLPGPVDQRRVLWRKISADAPVGAVAAA
ncbi:MAG: N-acetyltransferase [Brevundimonas sp.]|nr:MAG: N-acetyltransferase [Brevundimonas sp.]